MSLTVPSSGHLWVLEGGVPSPLTHTLWAATGRGSPAGGEELLHLQHWGPRRAAQHLDVLLSWEQIPTPPSAKSIYANNWKFLMWVGGTKRNVLYFAHCCDLKNIKAKQIKIQSWYLEFGDIPFVLFLKFSKSWASTWRFTLLTTARFMFSNLPINSCFSKTTVNEAFVAPFMDHHSSLIIIST